MAPFTELEPGQSEDERVDLVCAGLAEGGLLVHPTTSVYGIGGGSPRTDELVSRMKGRASSSPILRLVFDATRLVTVFPAVEWSQPADALAASFWPGPLTLVLDDGSHHGLAVRAESHPATRAVLERWEGTLGSTSLNVSGAAPAVTVAEARATLRGMADAGVPVLFLASGELPGPPPSTLVSLREGEPRLLRQGAIDRAELERVLGREIAP